MDYKRNLRENLWLAMDTLRNHKFRSSLTILGVLIGVTTVIVVASIFAGLDAELADYAKDFGARNMYIFKWDPGFKFKLTREERMRKPLTYEDGQAVKDQCPSVETVAVETFPNIFGPSPGIRYKDKEMLNANFLGATPNDFDVINAPLGDGRFFNEIDDWHRRNVVVIGSDIVTRFFEHEDPIGKNLVIGGNNFQVVGTLGKRKQFLGDNGADRAAYIPYHTMKKIYPLAKENFLIAMVAPGKFGQAIDEVTSVLRRRRHDKPSDPNSFGYTTAEAFITQFRQIIGMVVLISVVVSSIGLLVGGIGVMNIMLVSVTERTREIGVRKAVGALRADITWQFLLEAMTLTGSGGILGIAFGGTLSLLIRTLTNFPSTVPIWSAVVGFVVAAGVGLIFGMWPALKAARLDPIVALRYE